jgi:hypothetical protein
MVKHFRPQYVRTPGDIMSILRIASFFALGITATALAVGVPGSSILNESESGLDSHQAGRKSQTSKDWAALTK